MRSCPEAAAGPVIVFPKFFDSAIMKLLDAARHLCHFFSALHRYFVRLSGLDRKCTAIFLPFPIPLVVAKGKNNIYKYDMIKSKSEYGGPNQAGCPHRITGREPED